MNQRGLIASFGDFLAEALEGATGEGPICVHVRGSLVLLTELRRYTGDGPPYECDYFHKLASWHVADKFADRESAAERRQGRLLRRLRRKP